MPYSAIIESIQISSVVCRKKGGGGLCLCIDYRVINSNTINNTWLLLRIYELLSCLHKAYIFSKLDLYDRYHQIPVDPLHHHMAAFVCHYGAFEYTVVTFGFKNATVNFKEL